MLRKTRIDAPGALHHVIIRGIERSDIFKDGKDRNQFLTPLGTFLQETSTSCYAWALMDNHVHLLLRSGLSDLSLLMRRLLTGYAQYFNRRYSRSGHLFQNRYKSFLCEEEPYLLELIRYIHLNPLRAGAVVDMTALEKFPWSGHSALMGKRRLLYYVFFMRNRPLHGMLTSPLLKKVLPWVADPIWSVVVSYDQQGDGRLSNPYDDPRNGLPVMKGSWEAAILSLRYLNKQMNSTKRGRFFTPSLLTCLSMSFVTISK